MDYRVLADEKVLSPAALRIVRRHRPDADDPSYCRGCGKPVGACDVVALAVLVSAELRMRAVPSAAAERNGHAPAAAREPLPVRRKPQAGVERRAGIERRATGVAPA